MSTSGMRDAGPDVGAKRTSVRWRIFLLMLALVSINYVDRASLSVAMPLISDEFSIGPAFQGILLSCFFWTYALMQIPGGWLADRFGPRSVIAAATIGWGAFQALAAGAFNAVWLLLMRLGLGVTEGPIYPSGGKLNAVWMPPKERGRGAVILDGGAPLGTAIGGIIIAGLIGLFGSWRIAFIVAGVGTIAAGIFAYWYIRNSPANIGAPTTPRLRTSRQSTPGKTSRRFPRRRAGATSSTTCASVPSGGWASGGSASTWSSTAWSPGRPPISPRPEG